MCDNTRHDKIINDFIRESVGIEHILENMVENRLWWFENVKRRLVDFVVRSAYKMEKS